MGDSIRKMALVPMDYHMSQPPMKAQLNRLDSEMKHIMESTLPSDIKFKLYNHILHQHGAVGEELKKPMKVEIKSETPAPTKSPMTTESSTTNNFKREVAMKDLPKTTRNAANLLAEHVERNSDKFQFNDNGELIALGVPIEGSDMRDLFHYASRHLQTAPPPGWREFKSLLDDTRAPAKAIGNRNIHGTEAALAKALKSPPGTSGNEFSPSPAFTTPGVTVQPMKTPP